MGLYMESEKQHRSCEERLQTCEEHLQMMLKTINNAMGLYLGLEASREQVRDN